MSAPQPLGAGLKGRIDAIIAARNIDMSAIADTPDDSGPVEALRLSEQRIPLRYRNAVADHPGVLAWVRQVAEAAKPGPAGSAGLATGPSLLIAGPTGTGKTYQAYGAIRALLAQRVRLRWQAITSADLHAAMRPRPSGAIGHDPERVLAEHIRCPLLLLDDLGAAKPSEFTEELTYRLLNARYNDMTPTVFTTNLPIADLRSVLGDRIVSRLAEVTSRVVLDGADRRRITAA
jgi:DNA replication protein DnaC